MARAKSVKWLTIQHLNDMSPTDDDCKGYSFSAVGKKVSIARAAGMLTFIP